MVNIAEGNNELNISLIPVPIEHAPRVAAATFIGNYYEPTWLGYVIKATITVDTPEAFIGDIKIIIPGGIAVYATNVKDAIANAQAQVAHLTQKLADCDSDLCRKHVGKNLEEAQAKLDRLQTQGCPYPVGGNLDLANQYCLSYGDYHPVVQHIERLENRFSHISYTVFWPEGTSQFETIFYLSPDEFDFHKYHVGTARKLAAWVDIHYLDKVLSPVVELYDSEGNLLDSVEFENAIEVPEIDRHYDRIYC